MRAYFISINVYILPYQGIPNSDCRGVFWSSLVLDFQMLNFQQTSSNFFSRFSMKPCFGRVDLIEWCRHNDHND